jgi:hypothetical protein
MKRAARIVRKRLAPPAIEFATPLAIASGGVKVIGSSGKKVPAEKNK